MVGVRGAKAGRRDYANIRSSLVSALARSPAMGANNSRAGGSGNSGTAPAAPAVPDYYAALEVEETASADEIKVRPRRVTRCRRPSC